MTWTVEHGFLVENSEKHPTSSPRFLTLKETRVSLNEASKLELAVLSSSLYVEISGL